MDDTEDYLEFDIAQLYKWDKEQIKYINDVLLHTWTLVANNDKKNN